MKEATVIVAVRTLVNIRVTGHYDEEQGYMVYTAAALSPYQDTLSLMNPADWLDEDYMAEVDAQLEVALGLTNQEN